MIMLLPILFKSSNAPLSDVIVVMFLFSLKIFSSSDTMKFPLLSTIKALPVFRKLVSLPKLEKSLQSFTDVIIPIILFEESLIGTEYDITFLFIVGSIYGLVIAFSPFIDFIKLCVVFIPFLFPKASIEFPFLSLMLIFNCPIVFKAGFRISIFSSSGIFSLLIIGLLAITSRFLISLFI